jgi:hypothetical protein
MEGNLEMREQSNMVQKCEGECETTNRGGSALVRDSIPRCCISEHHPGCKGMSSHNIIKTLRNVSAIFHFASKTWIFDDSISTAQ